MPKAQRKSNAMRRAVRIHSSVYTYCILPFLVLIWLETRVVPSPLVVKHVNTRAFKGRNEYESRSKLHTYLDCLFVVLYILYLQEHKYILKKDDI